MAMAFQFRYRFRIATTRLKLTEQKKAISYVSVLPQKVQFLRVFPLPSLLFLIVAPPPDLKF
jgi:hypothetical protein